MAKDKNRENGKEKTEAAKKRADVIPVESNGTKESSTPSENASPQKTVSSEKSEGTECLPEPTELGDSPPVESKAKPTRRKMESASSESKRSSPAVFLLLMTLILIGAVGAGGYYGWQYLQKSLQETLQQERADTGALQERVNTQAEEIANLKEALQRENTTQQERLSAQEDGLSELQRRVSSQGSRLRDLSTATREDWLLAEAEYLLRLANQRLLTERTTKNPVSLLETADDILKGFDDPDLFAVRKLIATEITALRVAGELDREGLYLQLSSLSDVIPQLQLLIKPWDSDAPKPVIKEGEQEAGEESFGDRILTNAGEMLEGLKGYVRIQHRDQPIEPLLGPEEELYLRHNLRLMLEQAQLAMLREEPKIYRESLEKCRDWLQRYFQLNHTSEVLAQQLSELSQQSIEQGLPDITGSMETLRNYINLWHLQHEGAESQPETQQEAQP